MNKFDKARVSIYKMHEQLMYFNNGKMEGLRQHVNYYKDIVNKVIDIAEKQERLLYLYKSLTLLSQDSNEYFDIKCEILDVEKSLQPSQPYEDRLEKARYKGQPQTKPYIKSYINTSMGSLHKLEHIITVSRKSKLVRVSTTKRKAGTDTLIIEPFKITLDTVNMLKHILDELHTQGLEEELK